MCWTPLYANNHVNKTCAPSINNWNTFVGHIQKQKICRFYVKKKISEKKIMIEKKE